MPTPPGPPSSLDAELRETLDLLSRVVASVSDRLDTQAAVLARLDAAQPSPQLLATAAEKAVRERLEPSLHRLLDVVSDLTGDKARLRDRLRSITAEERRQSWWRRHVPSSLTLGAALLVALGLAFGLPRALAREPLPCRLIGGLWMGEGTGREACVFWVPE